MHELSVCLSLLREVERIARENKAGRVTKIAAGTVAENAELVIDVSDIVVRCSRCDAESPAKPNRLVCGECGDYRTNLVSGDEMVLQSLELDDIDRADAG